MVGIYKITSPNGRVYIGQSKNLEERLRYYSLKSSINQVKLHRSFKKYGIKSHKFEIIEQCLKEELNNRERYWQEYYEVLTKGLNCQLTTSENAPHEMSEEYKEAISTTLKRKYAEGKIVNPRKNCGKMLDMYDSYGNILKRGLYVEEAVDYLNVSNRSVINNGIRIGNIHITNNDQIVIPHNKNLVNTMVKYVTVHKKGRVPLYQIFENGDIIRCSGASKHKVVQKVLNSKDLMYYSKKNNSYYTFIGLLNNCPFMQ